VKILLFGSTGQVGRNLQRSLAKLGDLVALSTAGGPLCGDLRNHAGIRSTVLQVRPDIVVNAGAYTAVDRAEDEPQLAFAINAEAPGVLAAACSEIGAWLVHYSTDYVYDGSGERPWREEDPAQPLNVYGRSKLAGDVAVAQRTPRHLILRTGWVFDAAGHNFARTILRAAAEREALQVVNDQWGAPTSAALLAEVTAHLLAGLAGRVGDPGRAGVYHVAPAGFTTWHEYAVTLVHEALASGMRLRVQPDQIAAVPSSARPARARRPLNTRLDTERLRLTWNLDLPPWQDAVRNLVRSLADDRTITR
jgi:dTDP-4-dehydrorhamnose reductase